jgi:hypothetical protein
LYFLAKAELSASGIKITEALHNRKKGRADARASAPNPLLGIPLPLGRHT